MEPLSRSPAHECKLLNPLGRSICKSSSSSQLQVAGHFKRKMQHDEATWSELEEELLEDIVGRLTCFIDFVRFGAVCRSWQSVIVGMHGHLTSQDPWLMLPQREDNSMIRDFYILSRRKVFELKLPEAHARRCVGSTKGWLVMVDARLSIHLFNPCTRVQFKLPHQMTFQNQEHYLSGGFTLEELRDVFVLKVVLSSSPSNPDCMAMAIYAGDWWTLAIARPGDEIWTTIPSEWSSFVDVIHYKEQFYAINWSGIVVSCDVGAHMKTTLITTPVRQPSKRKTPVRQQSKRKTPVRQPSKEKTPVRQSAGQYYLVECSGELLQVIREVKLGGADVFPAYKTVGFSVFKLDFSSRLWVEMKSMGDYSLFLGYNTSFSFKCNDSLATGVKRDCIYFTDDYLEAHNGYSKKSAGSDKGVFHLEDGHIEPHYSGDGWHPFSLPIWFTPNK